MKKEHDTQEDKKDVKVNQPAGAPIAPDAGEAMPSRETLSHQWQKDSPALNTNVLAGYAVASTDNVMDKMDTPEKKAAREAADKLVHDQCSHLDAAARGRLDVSDRCYMNPSLDHSDKKAK